MPSYLEAFKIYKPRKTKDGVASQWEFSRKTPATDDKPERPACMFLVFANQTDSEGRLAQFDWPNKVTMKLGIADIGEILSVFIGLQKDLGPKEKDENGNYRGKGIYHETQRGNTILQLKKEDNKFAIRLSQKLKGQNVRIFLHSLTHSEVAVLTTLFRRAIELMYAW